MQGLQFIRVAALAVAVALLALACGSDDAGREATAGEGPTVVVSSTILGDVVANLVGDQAEVVTIMPVGADPHSFQPSAQQVALISEADAVILNGAGFEESLVDVVEAAEDDGVPTFAAMDAVDALPFDGDHDHDDDHDHGDDHDDDHEAHEREHGGEDPHFFTDPARMVVSANAMTDFLATLDGFDATALREQAAGYLADLEALDAEVQDILGVIPAERRVLVTSHEVFGYFADRYDFEVVGTVVPGNTTIDGASARELAELVEVIEEEGVPAIFTDASSSDELVQTLAAEVGDVVVVELFSESLGGSGSEAASYVEMVRTNANRIADALAG